MKKIIQIFLFVSAIAFYGCCKKVEDNLDVNIDNLDDKIIDVTKIKFPITTIEITEANNECKFFYDKKEYFKLNVLLVHLESLDVKKLKNGICLNFKFKKHIEGVDGINKKFIVFAKKMNIPLYSKSPSSSTIAQNNFLILYSPN
jgi:hypothetical protein